MQNQQIFQTAINNVIEKAKIELKLKSGNSLSQAEPNVWQYYLQINNLTNENIEDIEIMCNIPNHLELTKTFTFGSKLTPLV